MQRTTRPLACLAFTLMLLVPAAALAADEPGSVAPKADPMVPQEPAIADDVGHGLKVRQQNGISYVTGGAGDEQQDALERMSDQFNFKVTLAAQDGKYMGSTALRIESKEGTPVLETATEGPLFLAKLPPGQYTLRASGAGKSFSRPFTIGNSGQQQIVLTWPAHGSDTQAGDAPEPVK